MINIKQNPIIKIHTIKEKMTKTKTPKNLEELSRSGNNPQSLPKRNKSSKKKTPSPKHKSTSKVDKNPQINTSIMKTKNKVDLKS